MMILFKIIFNISIFFIIIRFNLINSTLYANIYNNNGKDKASLQNTNHSSKTSTQLCTFKGEGDYVTVVKDFSSSMGPGTVILDLPQLKENTFYFFRSNSGDNINYSNSYIKRGEEWEIGNAQLPINNQKKKQNKMDKKSRNKSENSSDNENEKDDSNNIWIIWLCIGILGVVLIFLIIGILFCR